MSKLEKYKELVEECNRQRQELANELAGNLPQLFEDIFRECPQLESFSWTQYTPYFNDGDECTFSAHIDEPSAINGESFYNMDEKDPNYDTLTTAGYKAMEILSSLGEDILKEMFGDHVEITVYKDRVDVDNCGHD